MTTLMGKLTARSKGAVRKAYEKLETRVLVAQGRKAVRNQAWTVAKVTRKAVKTGLVTGAVAATAVVVRAIRKRRREG